MKLRRFAGSYLDALFPLYYAKEEANNPDAAGFLAQLDLQLAEQIVYAMRFDLNCLRKAGARQPLGNGQSPGGGVARKIAEARPAIGHGFTKLR